MCVQTRNAAGELEIAPMPAFTVGGPVRAPPPRLVPPVDLPAAVPASAPLPASQPLQQPTEAGAASLRAVVADPAARPADDAQQAGGAQAPTAAEPAHGVQGVSAPKPQAAPAVAAADSQQEDMTQVSSAAGEAVGDASAHAAGVTAVPSADMPGDDSGAKAAAPTAADNAAQQLEPATAGSAAQEAELPTAAVTQPSGNVPTRPVETGVAANTSASDNPAAVLSPPVPAPELASATAGAASFATANGDVISAGQPVTLPHPHHAGWVDGHSGSDMAVAAQRAAFEAALGMAFEPDYSTLTPTQPVGAAGLSGGAAAHSPAVTPPAPRAPPAQPSTTIAPGLLCSDPVAMFLNDGPDK